MVDLLFFVAACVVLWLLFLVVRDRRDARCWRG